MNKSKHSFILVFAAVLGLLVLVGGCTATTGSSGTGTGNSGSVYDDDY